MHYRLFNTQKGSLIGQYPTITEAWDNVKQNKGKMILWKQEEVKGGWLWTQQPLRYYSIKEKIIFKIKTWIKLVTSK